jgi:hypothetical protein
VEGTPAMERKKVGRWLAAAEEWWAERKEKEVRLTCQSGGKGGRAWVIFKWSLSWILSEIFPKGI